MNKELKWINCAKFIAILYVLTDHTYNTLYDNKKILVISFCSVSLFILLSGITTYISNFRSESRLKYSLWKQVKKLGAAYLVATFIYQIVQNGSFDILKYLSYVLHFNVTGPFYFVFLYFQLILVGSVLFLLLKKTNFIQEIIVFISIILISILTTNHTNILDIYGGGGKLFGGTYFILFYIGMILAKYKLYEFKSVRVSLLTLFVSLVAYFSWVKFMSEDWLAFDKKFPFGEGINPPGVSLMLEAFLLLVVTYSFFTLMENIKYLNHITDIASWLGKSTLFIFLYHKLFLRWLGKWNHYMEIDNRYLKILLYFAVMIFGSIVIKICYDWVAKKIRLLM